MSRTFSFLTDFGDNAQVPELKTESEREQSKFQIDDDIPLPFVDVSHTDKKVIISLDFGSTHSGYCYALTKNKEPKCDRRENGMYKEPTCALFESNGRLQAFGQQARTMYLENLATTEMTDFINEDTTYRETFLYFDYNKLKMRLYNIKGLKERIKLDDLEAKASNGMSVPLENVVTAILAQLRQMAMGAVKRKENLPDLKVTDILWVLTVPAIWLEIDKQFMRRCALKAKLVSNFNSPDLVLALEPECAAIQLYSVNGLTLEQGTKILTLDCGGGTVDYCAVEVTSSPKKLFRCRQLLEASGGNWGSTYIDDRFFNILRKLFSKDVFEKAMLSPVVQQDIHRGWEELKVRLKRQDFVDGKSKGKYIELKSLVTECGVSLVKLVGAYNSVRKPELKCTGRRRPFKNATKLVLTPEVLRGLFDPVLRKVRDHTKRLLEKPELEGLDYIVLVGGFGKCDYLRKTIRDEIRGTDIELVAPNESSSVVMRGAVAFGLQPGVIVSRKCSTTIGLKSSIIFDPEIHNTEEYKAHRVFDERTKAYIVKNVFVPLVTRGQDVAADEVVERRFNTKKGVDSFKIDIYASKQRDINFVDNPKCVRVGQMLIPINPEDGDIQEISVAIQIGFTEIYATIRNLTTKTREVMRIDFQKTGRNAVIVDRRVPNV